MDSLEGEDVRCEPYRQRRQILEEFRLDGPQWKTPESFDDGERCGSLCASRLGLFR